MVKEDCFGFGGKECTVLKEMVCACGECFLYKDKKQFRQEAAEGWKRYEAYVAKKKAEEQRVKKAKAEGRIVIHSGVLYDV